LSKTTFPADYLWAELWTLGTELVLISNNIFFRNFFNWTWSYKTHSDIYDPYGYKFVKQGVQLGEHWKHRNLKMYDMDV
jgi:hypothetical protein